MGRYFALFSIILLQGCATGQLAVMTLEQTIQNAALAAKDGSNGASEKLNITVSVTNGYTAGATVPIPVVPIQLGASSLVGTKLEMAIDLADYTPPVRVSAANTVFILDTATGKLTPRVQN